MRILWFNWRDIRNPDSGGAEVFTHEIMRRLAEKGHQMTLFTARFPNCHPNENIDGVDIIREGGKYTVYSKAKKYYRIYHRHYDLVVDEINTRPFLTPTFVKGGRPIIAIIHQLAREFWFYETPFPVSYIGYYFLENRWLSHYRYIVTITVSDSTKKDLEQLGFRKVAVLPQGLSVKPVPRLLPKEPNPIIVFVGRLKRAKLPHHALHAFSLIKKEMPEAKMWVIGDGYMRKQLEKHRIKDVKFFGLVPNEKKNELISKAHLLLVPAVREGWGLVVTEANAMGTPVIGYDVPGLRDSIKDGETGTLVKENSPSALAAAAIALLKDPQRLTKISGNALEFSRQFSWDKATGAFNRIISKSPRATESAMAE
jgi:glycosyltransferase involved in cell wall biosynthesis